MQPITVAVAVSNPARIGRGRFYKHLPARFIGGHRFINRPPPAASQRTRAKLDALRLVSGAEDDRLTIDPGAGLINPASRQSGVVQVATPMRYTINANGIIPQGQNQFCAGPSQGLHCVWEPWRGAHDTDDRQTHLTITGRFIFLKLINGRSDYGPGHYGLGLVCLGLREGSTWRRVALRVLVKRCRGSNPRLQRI
jgi:hypothetical protein